MASGGFSSQLVTFSSCSSWEELQREEHQAALLGWAAWTATTCSGFPDLGRTEELEVPHGSLAGTILMLALPSSSLDLSAGAWWPLNVLKTNIKHRRLKCIF